MSGKREDWNVHGWPSDQLERFSYWCRGNGIDRCKLYQSRALRDSHTLHQCALLLQRADFYHLSFTGRTRMQWRRALQPGFSEHRRWEKIKLILSHVRASLVSQSVKNLSAMLEIQVWFLGQEDPLEKEMATQSSILAWEIPWTNEPGGLQSIGSQKRWTQLRD